MFLELEKLNTTKLTNLSILQATWWNDVFEDKIISLLIGALLGAIISMLCTYGVSKFKTYSFKRRLLRRKGSYDIFDKYGNKVPNHIIFTIHKAKGRTLPITIITKLNLNSDEEFESNGCVYFNSERIGEGYYLQKDISAYGVIKLYLLNGDTIGYVREFTKKNETKDGHSQWVSDSFVLRRK